MFLKSSEEMVITYSVTPATKIHNIVYLRTYSYLVRFEVLTAVFIKSTVFWDIYCDVHDVGVAVDAAWQRTRTQQWLMQQ
jgi:hypothetical protein